MRNREITNFSILLCAVLVFLFWSECQSYFVQSTIVSIHKRREHKEVDRIGSPNSKGNVVKNYCVDGDSGLSFSSRKTECSKVTGPIMRIEINSGNYLSLDSGHFIAPSEYCVIDRSIARFNPASFNYGKLCPSHSDPLWRKCCGESQILDLATIKCRKSRITFRPKVNDSLQSFVIPVDNSTRDFGKACPPGFVLRVYSKDPCLRESSGSFQLAPNGTPMYQASTGVFLRKMQLKPVEHDFYCVDGLLDFSSSCGNNYDDGKCRREMGEVLLVCMEEQDTFLNEGDNKGVPKAYFLAAIWLSTCPLLLSAAVANSCVIQKNVHGWILTSYLISMFLVNINSVVLILDLRPNSDGCGFLDFSMKFIYMSTLCWMTSMNFGLWRTFSSSVPQVVEPQRFLLSAVFSFGFPIIAVTGSYYAASASSTKNEGGSEDEESSSASTATCQRGTCALYSYKTLPYYSGPIIFLVLCNVGAFLKTSTTIASLRREAEAVLHKQTKDHVESFTLFAKLFLLTGSIWVIRVVLLVLQIQGLYLTWYGVALEAIFSIPEAVFPMIIFHHPEFIKWTWRKSPKVSRILVRCNPFCRMDLCKELNSLELQSGNHLSVQRNTSPTGNNGPIAVA